MSDALREEIARALYYSRTGAIDGPWETISSWRKKPRLDDVAAIMPIIARVRDEAYAKGINDAYSEGLPER